MLTQTTIDKSSWPPGPWLYESDLLALTEARTGYPLICNRDAASGNWNGYVGVPVGHVAYGAAAAAIPIAAYAGISYAGPLVTGDTTHWYIGFALGPPAAARPAVGITGLYLTQSAAIAETVQLAIDLSRLQALGQAGIITVALPAPPATPPASTPSPPTTSPSGVSVTLPAVPPITVPLPGVSLNLKT